MRFLGIILKFLYGFLKSGFPPFSFAVYSNWTLVTVRGCVNLNWSRVSPRFSICFFLYFLRFSPLFSFCFPLIFLLLHAFSPVFSMLGARNRVGIRLSYRPARLHRLAELTPWNRFLGLCSLLYFLPLSLLFSFNFSYCFSSCSLLIFLVLFLLFFRLLPPLQLSFCIYTYFSFYSILELPWTNYLHIRVRSFP